MKPIFKRSALDRLREEIEKAKHHDQRNFEGVQLGRGEAAAVYVELVLQGNHTFDEGKNMMDNIHGYDFEGTKLYVEGMPIREAS